MIPLKHLHVVLIYLAVINVVTFFMYGIDKWKAKKSKWRIRETALLGLAVLGGSIGAWLGMKVWHHKTQHKGGVIDYEKERNNLNPSFVEAVELLRRCGFINVEYTSKRR